MVNLDVDTINSEKADPKPTFVDDSVEMGKGALQKLVGKAKQVKDVVVDESKILATELPEEFRDSKKRLNAKPRVFSVTSNTFLYYAIVGLGLVWVIRKL